ncbi:MAG: protein-export chaperone SecB [Pseudomonadota bacterium]
MTDDLSTNGNGNGAAAGPAEAAQPRINVLGQYIKDLSFENPSAPQSLQAQGENPNLQLEISVQARQIGENAYESVIRFVADAKTGENHLYKLEFMYAGAFRLENIPEQVMPTVLYVDCPRLLFPFARRIAADVTREGGFPPLLLDPVDFAAIFQQNMKQRAAEQSEQNGDASA